MEEKAVAAPMPARVPLADIDPEAREVIEGCLRAARERLGMEISWFAEFSGDRKIFRVLEGERDEWGLQEDDWLPLTQSYCKRMYDQEIPNAIPDTSAQPEVSDLRVTRDLRIGSYIGVPLVLPHGQLRGAFCCARHSVCRELEERDVAFMQVMARMVADELAYRESIRNVRRLEQRVASIDALVSALEARDAYTNEHSAAVVDLAVAVGARLGLEGPALERVADVALLHDLGKVGIPDSLLRKPGSLSDQEWQRMFEHPAIGAEVVARIPQLEHLAPAIRAEHERWDGSGYPDGIEGDAIPIESRITLVCDAFHAMISDRPYREAMSRDEALAELRAHAGTMFWPEAVSALIAVIADVDAGRG